MASIEIHRNQIDYHRHTLRVLVVRIDGELVSESFQPFDASSVSISSRICEECYAACGDSLACCGGPNIEVRKHGDHIFWFHADIESISPLLPNAQLSDVWSFSIDDYEAQLAADTSTLPDFSSADMRLILQRGNIYPPHLGLFTIPDLTADPQGRQLLDFIAWAVGSSEFTICDRPNQRRTIRIGIESKGIPETILEVGFGYGHHALKFVANPSFPMWVTFGEVQRAVALIAD